MKEENEQLKAQLASIQENLDSQEKMNQEVTAKMDEVGKLLDDIEASEAAIFNLERGSYDDYSERIKNIGDYIESTKTRISELERIAAESENKNSGLSSMIAKLRKQVTEKETRITELAAQVDRLGGENASLIKTVDIQNQELSEKELLIEQKRAELSALEERIEQTIKQSKMDAADAYFARAQAAEEMAKRTKLAPRKKKETMKEAYDLYKKAFEAGHKEAFAKVEELEKFAN